MIAELKPYPAMKDSEVEWLEEVPEHWKVVPNRALFDEVQDCAHPKKHNKALVCVMTAFMKDDTELFKQFMDDEGFKRWMRDTVFGLTYEGQET